MNYHISARGEKVYKTYIIALVTILNNRLLKTMFLLRASH